MIHLYRSYRIRRSSAGKVWNSGLSWAFWLDGKTGTSDQDGRMGRRPRQRPDDKGKNRYTPIPHDCGAERSLERPSVCVSGSCAADCLRGYCKQYFTCTRHIVDMVYLSQAHTPCVHKNEKSGVLHLTAVRWEVWGTWAQKEKGLEVQTFLSFTLP